MGPVARESSTGPLHLGEELVGKARAAGAGEGVQGPLGVLGPDLPARRLEWPCERSCDTGGHRRPRGPREEPDECACRQRLRVGRSDVDLRDVAAGTFARLRWCLRAALDHRESEEDPQRAAVLDVPWDVHVRLRRRDADCRPPAPGPARLDRPLSRPATNMRSAERFAVGTRVGIEVHVGCGTCDRCREGMYTLCQNYGKRETGHAHVGFTIGGGLAEYAAVPIAALHALPEHVTFEQGAWTDNL